MKKILLLRVIIKLHKTAQVRQHRYDQFVFMRLAAAQPYPADSAISCCSLVQRQVSHAASLRSGLALAGRL